MSKGVANIFSWLCIAAVMFIPFVPIREMHGQGAAFLWLIASFCIMIFFAAFVLVGVTHKGLGK